MRYEIYKDLTKKQKEEYDYKFKHDKLSFSGGAIIMTTLAVLSVSALFVLMAFIIVSDSRFDYLKQSVVEVLVAVKTLVYIGVVSIIVIVFYDVVDYSYKYYSLKKWQKINNIKVDYLGRPKK